VYWNNVFDTPNSREPRPRIGIEEIDKAIDWLAQTNGRILDFGCGNGSLLFAVLFSGASHGVGIDISPNAIALAKEAAQQAELSDQVDFFAGGIEKLADLKPRSFDGAMLSNILDNIYPEDAQSLSQSVDRLLKPGARLVVKLNPLLEEDFFEDNDDYALVSENFYKESSGLFLYNLNDDMLFSMLDTFRLEGKVDVYFEQHDLTNRLYYFVKK
jgi:SAM-dependent methyltransferase